MSIRIDNQQQYIDHNDSVSDTFVDDLTLNNLTVTGSLTGGSITHTLQQAYEDSSDGNIQTNGTQGIFSIQQGTGIDLTTTLAVRDNAGGYNFLVNGLGDVVCTDLNSSDISDNGATCTITNLVGSLTGNADTATSSLVTDSLSTTFLPIKKEFT